MVLFTIKHNNWSKMKNLYFILLWYRGLKEEKTPSTIVIRNFISVLRMGKRNYRIYDDFYAFSYIVPKVEV